MSMGVLNSKANIDCFCMYLSLTDYNHFPVVFTLCQKLNLLNNKHSPSNLQKVVVVLQDIFHNDKNSQVFFVEYYI